MKLLAIDMDGTCLNSKRKLTDETLDALIKAKKEGVEIVPITGRPFNFLPKAILENDLCRYVITSNGAYVYDLKENKFLKEAIVPIEDAVEIINRCNKRHAGIAANIKEDYIYHGGLIKLIGRFVFGKEITKVAIQVDDLASYIKENNSSVGEIQMFYLSKKYENRIIQVVDEYKDLMLVHNGKCLEIFSKEATKGKALDLIREKLNIKEEDVISIGDSENDLTMFDHAGLKLAMGNAVEKLKELADHILPSNDDFGVKVAIERFILNNFTLKD